MEEEQELGIFHYNGFAIQPLVLPELLPDAEVPEHEGGQDDGAHVLALHQLEALADEQVQDALAAGSMRQYLGYIVKFLGWLPDHYPGIVNEEFARGYPPQVGPERTSYIQEWMDCGKDDDGIERGNGRNRNPVCPLDLRRLTTRMYGAYLSSLRTRTGSIPSAATLKSHRSGLTKFFKLYDVAQTPEFMQEMQDRYRGVNRQHQRRAGAGLAPVKVGKDPLPFELYKALAGKFLEAQRNGRSQRDAIFSHTFLILSWNLMCRASNIVHICFQHMEWVGDSLRIYFAHSKTDQFGEHPKDPRHVYANPVHPEICAILSLGIYLMTYTNFGLDEDANVDIPVARAARSLFPGNNQYDTYRKTLDRYCDQNGQAGAELARLGIDPNDIGTHSARKGSATYTSSGSTCCPPIPAICLRANWSLGGVQDRYIRYENASDQYVGRTASGLPPTDIVFATLPPFFSDTAHPDVVRAKELCFPAILRRFPQFQNICSFLLASVVYHYDFLRRKMTARHILFDKPLFRDPALIRSLRGLVCCRLQQTGDAIRVTGIPPHIIQMVQYHHLQNEVGVLRNFINNLIDQNQIMSAHLQQQNEDVAREIVERLQNDYEERANQVGQLTYLGIRNLFHEILQEYQGPIQAPVEPQHDDQQEDENLPPDLENGRQDPPAPPQNYHPALAGEIQLFNHHGRGRRIPEDFAWPTSDVGTMWELWLCGDAARQYPPLSKIRPQDLKLIRGERNGRNMCKRLSDLKYLMTRIMSRLPEDRRPLANRAIRVEEARELFELGREAVAIPAQTIRGRERLEGHHERSWTTVLRVIRQELNPPDGAPPRRRRQIANAPQNANVEEDAEVEGEGIQP